jgi:hypothetical protein
MKQYLVKKCSGAVDLSAAWNSPEWNNIPVVKIDNFHERSSSHHPVTECKLQHDDAGFYGLFQVQDQYVKAVNIGLNASVCRDSCVEFFVEPPGGKGYFNFEFNCGGSMLLYYIEDCSRGENGFKKYAMMTEQEVAGVKIFHTLPQTVDPEITEPVTWRLGFYIPFKLFTEKTGFAGGSNQTWRANFYKCADGTSRPHWAMWNPVTILNFHQPDHFADIVLE